MIVLRVDGVELPLRSNKLELPPYDASRLRSVEVWRSGVSVEVEVLSTADSDRVFSYASDLHRGKCFNDELHIASLEFDGILFFEGQATLLATEHSNAVSYYLLKIRCGGSDWADMIATTELGKSAVEASLSMTLHDIEQSWSGKRAIRMLPLQRDSYPMPQDSGLWGAQRVLMPTDYHPFISVAELLHSTATRAGYSIQSSWLESPLAQKLMMSGAYREVDVEAAERAMGFKAYRTTTTSAKANSSGYVYASNPLSSTSVGAIVDSVDASAVDDEGNTLADAYSNGGALRFENGRPLFTPTRNISVAYEYKIRYTTDFRITSRSTLRGFDRIYLGAGCQVELKLENPYTDQSKMLKPNIAYKLFIFDYDANNSYMLSDIGEVSGRISEVVTPKGVPSQTRLYVKLPGASFYALYSGDWALYNGFVEECGTRDVELLVRTPYHELSAKSTNNFDSIAFSGAEKGQQLTLRSGCSLRPIFSQSVGYGDTITFADVAHHPFTEQCLVEALAQMFNLCVYTYEPSRTIVIEPYDDFFSGNIVDFRDRQIDGEWSIVEGAPESFERVRLMYRGSDGVVSRQNSMSDKEFGVWTKEFASFATKQGTHSSVNPLFLPTLSLSGYIGSVPSAEVLTVGDRESVVERDYVEPRVVLYHGMRTLPVDEKWTAHTSTNSYPYAAFHSEAMGETLCFEDRDGCEGLHRYHDRELEEIALRGLLRCKILLPVADYVSLFDPHNESLSIRSRFRLEIEGAASLYTLRSIEHYDPLSGVATCLFRRQTTD